MEQTRALNALEPFLALSKSANSPRAAANLVTQATSAPNTYVFAELLQTPNIQSLRKSEEYAGFLTLLEIFAWGTWQDYKAHGSLPQLSAQQRQKLLLLSLLPLSSSHATLTYSSLMAALDLPTTRALEEFITTAIYSGLLSATLDPAHSLLLVTSTSPLRDLAPGSLPILQATMQTWSQRCDSALLELEAQVAAVKKAAVDREKQRRKHERALELSMQIFDDKSTGKRGVGGLGDEDMMDIDQEGGSGRLSRGQKRGGSQFTFGGLGMGRRLG
ncbi:hypothetical protein K505DRAFT_248282 [Melanomma pulvis-pyrius CBS 109.77]|uniref:PCI domain-containing protein n=1 Tax=Melanomma pulvis-pyrius CBS 109.77 TaxID=1314802 RepID=A0A6A6X667_9PLEO|nr:hypothetical protein K505DRAFT_248282 [Melanomma pulvis-pyrius CBS 109.77]